MTDKIKERITLEVISDRANRSNEIKRKIMEEHRRQIPGSVDTSLVQGFSTTRRGNGSLRRYEGLGRPVGVVGSVEVGTTSPSLLTLGTYSRNINKCTDELEHLVRMERESLYAVGIFFYDFLAGLVGRRPDRPQDAYPILQNYIKNVRGIDLLVLQLIRSYDTATSRTYETLNKMLENAEMNDGERKKFKQMGSGDGIERYHQEKEKLSRMDKESDFAGWCRQARIVFELERNSWGGKFEAKKREMAVGYDRELIDNLQLKHTMSQYLLYEMKGIAVETAFTLRNLEASLEMYEETKQASEAISILGNCMPLLRNCSGYVNNAYRRLFMRIGDVARDPSRRHLLLEENNELARTLSGALDAADLRDMRYDRG